MLNTWICIDGMAFGRSPPGACSGRSPYRLMLVSKIVDFSFAVGCQCGAPPVILELVLRPLDSVPNVLSLFLVFHTGDASAPHGVQSCSNSNTEFWELCR